jgi:ABC-type glutathione transport system ATPase component
VLFGAVAKQKYNSQQSETDKKRYEADRAKYEAEKAKHESEIVSIVAPKDHAVYLSDLNHDATWRQAHLDARQYANGKPSLPEKWEIEQYRAYHSSKQISPSQLVIEQSQTTLSELIDQYPHIWIYGGTGGGKTTLLRYIAHRRKVQGHDVIVLDSKEHPAKWTGLIRIRESQKIEATIQKVIAIYQANSDALSSGQAIEDEFTQITIVSDEWTSIIKESELAQQFTDEMTREA